VTGELQDLHSKVDQVLTILRGGHDANGQWTAGVSPRLEDHERRIGDLEDGIEAASTRRVSWVQAFGISIFGASVGQIASYIKDHIK